MDDTIDNALREMFECTLFSENIYDIDTQDTLVVGDMKFRKYDQSQTKFVTLDYRKILGEDSDAVLLNDIIESLDLSTIEERFGEEGNPAYHPKAMMKILIYGYYKGYFGGRPLHRNYETDLGLRYLFNDDFPDHRTINLFRVNFKDEIADVFTQVVMLCGELRMIGFENLAVDSQKIRANANVFQNKNIDGVRKEKRRIRKQLRKLLEDEVEFRQDPDEIKKRKEKLARRKRKLEAASRILKDAGGEDDKGIRHNLTDPESRVMTDKRGVKNPGYSCHNGVDDRYQVLTAVKVTNAPTDEDELFSMKEISKRNTGRPHKNTIGDCGYGDKIKYRDMEDDHETEYYVPDRTMHSSEQDKYSKWKFKYDKGRDTYTCPEGEDLPFVRVSKDSRGLEYRLYRGVGCEDCDVRDRCIRKAKKGCDGARARNRVITVYPEDELVVRMREKLKTDQGKAIYQRRMETVEPVHGDMQKNRGFVQFVLRGLEKVNIEYNLMGIAHNVRKIILHGGDRVQEIRGRPVSAA